MTKIIGLTGTVASGKNFVAQIFADLGASVFDADKEVHEILEKNKIAINKIQKEFPESFVKNKIDRKILGNLVFKDKKKKEILEKIIHPIVKQDRHDFIKRAIYQRKELIILNIPLLFEKNIHFQCHHNILVTAPKFIQKHRFLKREKSKNIASKSNLIVAKFEDILQNQISDRDKERMADFIIKNGQNRSSTFRQTIKIFKKLIKNERE